jgi:hypothetical protein
MQDLRDLRDIMPSFVVVRNANFAELYILFAVDTSTRKLAGQAVQI